MPKTGFSFAHSPLRHFATSLPSLQLQLLSWLEMFPIAEVVQKVAAPPPDGFGIKTYITSLRRFQARMNNEARSCHVSNFFL